MKNATIYSGSSNPNLAQELSTLLQIPLGKVEIGEFANGEIRLRVLEPSSPHAIVMQSLSIPTERNLIECAILCDALHRHGASQITAVIPWIGYSKQDKVFRSGEPLSIKVVANILQSAKIDRLVTVDLHNPAIPGFFEIPVTNISAQQLFIEHFQKYALPDQLVIAPDAGAVKSAGSFAEALRAPICYLDKQRDLGTGVVSIRGASSEVKGKDCIIADDNIFTGATLIESAEYLIKHDASSVHTSATHYLGVHGVDELIDRSPISSVTTTNTIANAFTSPKFKILSIAPAIAKSLDST